MVERTIRLWIRSNEPVKYEQRNGGTADGFSTISPDRSSVLSAKVVLSDFRGLAPIFTEKVAYSLRAAAKVFTLRGTHGQFYGETFAIDYSFYVLLSPFTNFAAVFGIHDAYPSFTVRVNGAPIYYVHETGGPLLGPPLLALPPVFGGLQTGHW